MTKVLKLDEKNQYGFGMTKPLPTGYIKQNLDTSWRTFNLLLQNVSLMIKLVTFTWLILNLIILNLQINN